MQSEKDSIKSKLENKNIKEIVILNNIYKDILDGKIKCEKENFLIIKMINKANIKKLKEFHPEYKELINKLLL